MPFIPLSLVAALGIYGGTFFGLVIADPTKAAMEYLRNDTSPSLEQMQQESRQEIYEMTGIEVK